MLIYFILCFRLPNAVRLVRKPIAEHCEVSRLFLIKKREK